MGGAYKCRHNNCNKIIVLTPRFTGARKLAKEKAHWAKEHPQETMPEGDVVPGDLDHADLDQKIQRRLKQLIGQTPSLVRMTVSEF